MFELGCRGMTEAKNLTSLGIDARHHMTDDAVLARRVHGLKNHEHRKAVGGVENALALGGLIDRALKQLFVVLF